jgi:hypothetical protein
LIEGENRRGQVQFQQILLAGQMQGGGLGHRSFALLQEIGNVFATERLIGPGVFQGASHLLEP